MGLPDEVLAKYIKYVSKKYPDCESSWPIMHGFGYDLTVGIYKNYYVLIFRISSGLIESNGIGEISQGIVGVEDISQENIHIARKSMEKYFQVKEGELLFILKKDMSNIEHEFELAMKKQEKYLGLSFMKIFLSHKSLNKPKVRKFKSLLTTLGFQVWLDEDDMPAGDKLERALLKGFQESCAAIFFITPDYLDEGFLQTEVDYAIAEKRKKGDEFSIISLVMKDQNNKKGTVPELLKSYVWKEPKDNLEAIEEIIKALPIKVGEVQWKQPT